MTTDDKAVSGAVAGAARESGPARESTVRRAAYAVLAAAVRGRRERGGEWGEAVLAEFAQTHGGREAVRWTLGGLRAAWHERRRRARHLPRRVRVARRAVVLLVLAVAVGLVVNQWVLTVRRSPSGSMADTVRIGDRYLVDKVGFHLTGLHRGDIVEARLRRRLRRSEWGRAPAAAAVRLRRRLRRSEWGRASAGGYGATRTRLRPACLAW